MFEKMRDVEYVEDYDADADDEGVNEDKNKQSNRFEKIECC